MGPIKLLIAVLMFVSASLAAFEFNNTNATYDFTQTVDIFIVDKNGSKFFAMIDPFEMKVTTGPSRFYITVRRVCVAPRDVAGGAGAGRFPGESFSGTG